MDHPKIKVLRNQLMGILALLNEDDDEQLTLDMIEGETDLFELVGTLLDGIEHDDGSIFNLEEQIRMRQQRIARLEKRIAERKALIQSLMETAGIKKIPLPQATVFTSNRPGTIKVTEPEKLTEEFTRKVTTVKPDMDKIKSAIEAGIDVPGAHKTNGSTILTVRRL